MSNLDTLAQTYLPEVEDTLQRLVARVNGPGLQELHDMLAYHMGWEGPGAGPETRGKRIRPLLVLLTAQAAGGEWRLALPAAAAVELLHNFSLIHDDIQDNSPLRRGRQTVWKRWGVAQAINAGDSMFTLAHLANLDLAERLPAETALQASRLLQETCLKLTQGQYMDMAYEARGDLHLEAYWPMIGGKTAALLAACTGLGALVAGAGASQAQAYLEFGRNLGLAFQIQDDLLGIWGDANLTGKSVESDLVSGKKSLPVLYGLRCEGEFARRWAEGPVANESAVEMARLLEAEGAREYTAEHARRLTAAAHEALEAAQPRGQAGQALHELAQRLLGREV